MRTPPRWDFMRRIEHAKQVRSSMRGHRRAAKPDKRNVHVVPTAHTTGQR